MRHPSKKRFFIFRIADSDLSEYNRVAGENGMSLSGWLRYLANREVMKNRAKEG